LLIAAISGIPDPEGAAILIESITKVTDNESLKIETQELREQGADLKRRMEQIIRSVREQQQQQQGQAQGQEQTGIGEGLIMYG
jgi:predicted ATP-grasp superfamily ATP-dependent carboligase